MCIIPSLVDLFVSRQQLLLTTIQVVSWPSLCASNEVDLAESGQAPQDAGRQGSNVALDDVQGRDVLAICDNDLSFM